jgi:4-hydroxybenzoate polyprenyltransferase
MLRRFLELIRFSHTIFALPFALAAAVMAWSTVGFRWLDLIGILACMVTARSFAMAFNRLADRDLDALNPRTRNRHLPAGLLSIPAVTIFTVICAALFIASTLLFTNRWPLNLSGPVLVLLGAYSLTKRFTSLAHFWLGVSLAFAPVAAWIAIRGLDNLLVPSLLGGGVLFWVAGFDILYACQDADFDHRAGLYSIPARFGVPRALSIAAVSHAAAFAFFLALGFVSPQLGWVFRGTVLAVGVLLIYEHRIVRPDDLTRVNQAFFTVNGIISVAILAAVLVECLVISSALRPAL